MSQCNLHKLCSWVLALTKGHRHDDRDCCPLTAHFGEGGLVPNFILSEQKRQPQQLHQPEPGWQLPSPPKVPVTMQPRPQYQNPHRFEIWSLPREGQGQGSEGTFMGELGPRKSESGKMEIVWKTPPENAVAVSSTSGGGAAEDKVLDLTKKTGNQGQGQRWVPVVPGQDCNAVDEEWNRFLQNPYEPRPKDKRPLQPKAKDDSKPQPKRRRVAGQGLEPKLPDIKAEVDDQDQTPGPSGSKVNGRRKATPRRTKAAAAAAAAPTATVTSASTSSSAGVNVASGIWQPFAENAKVEIKQEPQVDQEVPMAGAQQEVDVRPAEVEVKQEQEREVPQSVNVPRNREPIYFTFDFNNN